MGCDPEGKMSSCRTQQCKPQNAVSTVPQSDSVLSLYFISCSMLEGEQFTKHAAPLYKQTVCRIPCSHSCSPQLPLSLLLSHSCCSEPVACTFGVHRMLEGDEFIKRVVPSISRLFGSSDRNLRRNLLESIDSYGHHLTQEVVEVQIYPPLSAGFNDENAYIRELTLKAVLILAPKMKQSTLTQNLLKHLSRLQVDNEPSIRANTTVLLGNIAQYLGDTYCKKVLLNAFGRALKDSFPPARVAALRALVATAKYYSPDEMACRALPTVAPLCVDQLADVRSAALACLDTFEELLKENDTKLQKEAAAAAAAGNQGAAAAGPAISISNSGGMLGWAMSSLAASSAAFVGSSAAASIAPAAVATVPSAAVSSSALGPSAAPAAVAAHRTSSTGGGGIGISTAAASGGRGGTASKGGDTGALQLASSSASGAQDGWDKDFDDMDNGLDTAEQEVREKTYIGFSLSGGGFVVCSVEVCQ
eukprot:GHRR01025421.1.p1 GENE.GHRR01025421.1~~GHRR01025421.1.p1  ORF type:complete len:475 (+),score=152.72 GHRR01025421.1:1950-3374(+)